jgi:hypothetical protein
MTVGRNITLALFKLIWNEWSQRERVREPAESLSSRGGVTSSSQTPLLLSEAAPFQNMRKFGKNKNMFMSPDGA